MARSTTVWVITQATWPVAAFTVKHELKTWLRSKNTGQLLNLRVWRCQDGVGVLNVGGNDYLYHYGDTQRPVEVPISEILK